MPSITILQPPTTTFPTPFDVVVAFDLSGALAAAGAVAAASGAATAALQPPPPPPHVIELKCVQTAGTTIFRAGIPSGSPSPRTISVTASAVGAGTLEAKLIDTKGTVGTGDDVVLATDSKNINVTSG